MTKANKEWSGERLETFILGRDAVDHLHRYALVERYIAGKTVLDIASGEGYGSRLMSRHAAHVHGVDIDSGAVRKAAAKYLAPNLDFRTGSADAIPFADASIDVVVSFETIEHHDRHDEMLSEIKRVLKPGGMLVISTPDKLYYSDKRDFRNKFHVRELYKDEFRALIAKHFGQIQMLRQQHLNGNSIISDDAQPLSMHVYRGNFSEIHNHEIDPLYLVAIASDSHFEKQPVSVFDGTVVARSQIEQIINDVRATSAYKLGRLLLSPFKLFQKTKK